MGKKKRQKDAAAGPKSTEQPTAGTSAGNQGAAPEGLSIQELGAELMRYPTLLMASVFLAFSIIAIWEAVRYGGDVNMGVVREPTSIIVWIALTVTLFASYWRQRSRQSNANS